MLIGLDLTYREKGNSVEKIHDGCCIKIHEVVAVWSEMHVDPKLDFSCYLVRVLFTNNPTILTIASYDTKAEADKLVQRIYDT